MRRGNAAADDMKYGDGREEAHSHSRPARSHYSTPLARSFLPLPLSIYMYIHRRDTDNMQMEHRATAIIYGSYHAAHRFDDSRVCGLAHATGRNRESQINAAFPHYVQF